jgi:hypothetical protein
MMRAKIRWLICCGVFAPLMAGCLSHPAPIIDTQHSNMAHYEEDLAECEGYGEQVQLETGVAKGAVAGGAVGAASGAILGNAGTGAGLGAIGGASRSAQIWEREHARVVKNCLRVRGYRVLN